MPTPFNFNLILTCVRSDFIEDFSSSVLDVLEVYLLFLLPTASGKYVSAYGQRFAMQTIYSGISKTRDDIGPVGFLRLSLSQM